MSPSKRFITMAEYAKAKGVSRNTPYKWADKLEPYFHRDGKKLLLDTELMAQAGLWPVTDGDNLGDNLATVSATNEPDGDNLGDSFPADGDKMATTSARIEADEPQDGDKGDNLGDKSATVSDDHGDNLGDIQKLAIMALRDEVQDLRNEITALKAEKLELIKRYEAQLAAKDLDLDAWKHQAESWEAALKAEQVISHTAQQQAEPKKLEAASHGGDHPQGEKKSLREKILGLFSRGNDAV